MNRETNDARYFPPWEESVAERNELQRTLQRFSSSAAGEIFRGVRNVANLRGDGNLVRAQLSWRSAFLNRNGLRWE